MICSKCKNHYLGKGYHCWSGNKSLNLCNFNGLLDKKAKVYGKSKFTTLGLILEERNK